MTQEQIGSKYGISQDQVSKRLSLLNITEETKAITTRVVMEKTEVTPSHLEIIASVREPEKQKEIAEKIMSQGLSVRETETEVKKLLAPEAPPTVNPFEEKHEPPYDFECPCLRRYKIDWEKKTIQEVVSTN